MLLPSADCAAMQWLSDFIRDASDQVDGANFWISNERLAPGVIGPESRPFCWEPLPFGSEIAGFEDEEEAETAAPLVQQEFGFRPGTVIVFSAMCNSTIDHRILGLLAMTENAGTAELFTGF
jgi:hypothetical protein